MASRQEIVDKYFPDVDKQRMERTCEIIESAIEIDAREGKRYLSWAFSLPEWKFCNIEKIMLYFKKLGYIVDAKQDCPTLFIMYVQW